MNNIRNRVKCWWKLRSTPYSEHDIDYLLGRRKNKKKSIIGFLVIDFILFISVFLSLFIVIDVIDIVMDDGGSDFLGVVLLLGILSIVILLVFLSNRFHNDFLALDIDYDLVDLFIYLKRMNNEYEHPKDNGGRKL